MKHGPSVMETKEPGKLEEFRTLVTSMMVRFWDDPRDIKLAIHETLNEFSYSRELAGWIPGSEMVDVKALVDEIAQLRRDNTALQEQLKRSSPAPATFNQFTFDEMYDLMLGISINDDVLNNTYQGKLNRIADAFGDETIGLIHFFWMLRDLLQVGIDIDMRLSAYSYVMKLEAYGFVEIVGGFASEKRFGLNEIGKQFLLRLRMERNVKEADKHVIEPKEGSSMRIFSGRRI